MNQGFRRQPRRAHSRRAVVAHADLVHAVAGLAIIEIDVHGAVRCADGPEETVGGDAGIVVDDLMCVRVEGVNNPPVDVKSDEGKAAFVISSVRSAEDPLA
jgi:hypothetical protein